MSSNGEEVVIIDDPNSDTSPSTTTTFLRRNRCCFHFPCFSPGPTATATPRHLTLGGPTSTSSSWGSKWWARPYRAFKKIREWSEIYAGPKWKTFIRKFNRNHRHRHHHHHGSNATAGKFQYDPLSYALNFDDGHGQGADEDYGAEEHFPDFSSRFASVPISARSSMDLGRGAPAS